MTTVVVIVPPVGPPIPVVVGRSVGGGLFLNDAMRRRDLEYLEDDGREIYLNGTIAYRCWRLLYLFTCVTWVNKTLFLSCCLSCLVCGL